MAAKADSGTSVGPGVKNRGLGMMEMFVGLSDAQGYFYAISF
jgi:hypothetical protein